jgi:pimeloyl-ACP methyl ester carboxylesterase
MSDVRTHAPTPSVHRELLEVLPKAPTDKPPLLFVHGAWHGAWCFREHWMPEAAARGWPCYALSLRGHGGSDGTDDLGTTPLGRYEQDVLETIAQLHEAPVLIGHSMGGLITQRVAAREPRVRAAVLVASVPPRHHLGAVSLLLRHDPKALVRALVGREPDFRPATLFGSATAEETAARHTSRTGPESLVATHQLVLPRGAETPQCPTLVLGGGDDRLVSPHSVVRTARACGTQARLFRGLGHNLMLEDDWEAPLDVLLEWLERTLTT